MPTLATPRLVRPSIRPTLLERGLAFAAIALLAAVVAAILRGAPDWRGATFLIWLHLATIMAALVLTPLLLLMPRGVRRHRVLGYAWVLAMMTTAALSFWIRTINPGGFSAIHLLSALTFVAAPMIAWRAHRHDVRRHRISAITLTASALLIAGFFTFPFARLLGRWLFA